MAGIHGVHLIVSLDCDTSEDAAVAWDVHQQLSRHGINPLYAVAGELVERHPDEYGRLVADGAEFMNHGNREHTYFDTSAGRYASCYFYGDLSAREVRDDIERGNATLRRVLGVSPRGYRTPHFGTYQRPAQLRYVHSILKQLDYRYSSSTGPLYGMRYGPIVSRFGLPEMPCSGTYSRPMEILDSWSYFAAPGRSWTRGDYLQECTDLADALGAAGSGVLNLYADPSHVADSNEFFAAMEYCASRARPSSYRRLLEEAA